MKIVFKPPCNPSFPLEPGWNPLDKPFRSKTFWLAMLGLFPLMLIMVFAFNMYIEVSLNIILEWDYYQYLLFGFITLLLHELIHAFLFPGSLFSDKTYIGISAKYLIGFAHYDGVLTRNRLILILLAPFVTLSIVPVLLTTIPGLLPNWAVSSMLKIALINAPGSVPDLYSALKILKLLNRDVYIFNNGTQLYWKEKR